MTELEGDTLIPSFLNLGKVWALAHYLGGTEVQNCVIDAIIFEKFETQGVYVVKSSLQHIGRVTPPDSTIQQLLKEATIRRIRSATVEEMKELLEDIILEAAFRQFNGKGCEKQQPFPTLQERCKYHDHAEGEPRCK